MYFSTGEVHKITVHMYNSQLEFRSSMKEIVDANANFVRVHTSHAVNVLNVDSIHQLRKEVKMKNGEICKMSVRGMKNLEKALKNNE